MTKERTVATLFLDYRPYVERGFFFSPDAYSGEFDALGEIEVSVYPAICPVPNDSVTDSPQTEGPVYDPRAYSYSPNYSFGAKVAAEVISGSELLELIYKEAMKVGADGVADLSCREVYLPELGSRNPLKYVVRGLAIKRK